MVDKRCWFSAILLIVVVVVTLLIVADLNSKSEQTDPTKILTGLQNTTVGKERKAIADLRALLSPEDLYAPFTKENSYLIRWIRDSNFDLKQTVENLRMSLKWRIENSIDSILDEDYSDIYKYCPYTTNVRDNNGNIVVVVPVGKWKLRRATIPQNMPRMNRSIFHLLESVASMLRNLRKSGKDAGVVGILDLKGFSYIEHGCLNCISLISKIITTHENHYPGYIKTWYLINVSRLAQAFIDIFVPLLSPKSRKTMKVYGYDKEEWGTELKKTINPDQLPLQFGTNKSKTA